METECQLQHPGEIMDFMDTGGKINVGQITSMDGQQPIVSDFTRRNGVAL